MKEFNLPSVVIFFQVPPVLIVTVLFRLEYPTPVASPLFSESLKGAKRHQRLNVILGEICARGKNVQSLHNWGGKNRNPFG
jgi:hypothetical protein